MVFMIFNMDFFMEIWGIFWFIIFFIFMVFNCLNLMCFNFKIEFKISVIFMNFCSWNFGFNMGMDV